MNETLGVQNFTFDYRIFHTFSPNDFPSEGKEKITANYQIMSKFGDEIENFKTFCNFNMETELFRFLKHKKEKIHSFQ